jgi:acetoin utilization deacetylase AcuC-like enzyme
MPTGIFFHYQQGERLRDFPEALDGILEKDNVFFYDAFYISKPSSEFDLEPIPTELIQRVHSPEMISQIKSSGAYDGALYSAAGTVSAAAKIFSGDINNAFVFTGYGDHHAGSTFYGGGCYFNGAAIAIHELRSEFDVRRFAVIDTDAHHGDGSWELFANSADVLYMCFCASSSMETNFNVDIHVPYRTGDEHYLDLVRDSFRKHIIPFKPEIIFWNWGYDGTVGDYGDMGLSPDFQLKLATEIKLLSNDISGGRLVVVLCGGSRRDLATLLIPRIIEILAA